jgi:hypothetical protein
MEWVSKGELVGWLGRQLVTQKTVIITEGLKQGQFSKSKIET